MSLTHAKIRTTEKVNNLLKCLPQAKGVNYEYEAKTYLYAHRMPFHTGRLRSVKSIQHTYTSTR